MRVYYDGPDALVTEQYFVWRTCPRRTFVVSDLRNVRLVQRHVGSPRVIVSTAAVAAVALIIAPGWLLLDTMAGRLVLLGAAFGAVTLATLGKRSLHQCELRADYRMHEMVLYTTIEMRTFNQVARALRRAVEAAGARRREYGMAAR